MTAKWIDAWSLLSEFKIDRIEMKREQKRKNMKGKDTMDYDLRPDHSPVFIHVTVLFLVYMFLNSGPDTINFKDDNEHHANNKSYPHTITW